MLENTRTPEREDNIFEMIFFLKKINVYMYVHTFIYILYIINDQTIPSTMRRIKQKQKRQKSGMERSTKGKILKTSKALATKPRENSRKSRNKAALQSMTRIKPKVILPPVPNMNDAKGSTNKRTQQPGHSSRIKILQN